MHRKISSLIAAITIVLLTVTITSSVLQIYPAKGNGNPITITSITNAVSMSPMTLTLSTLPETDTYWVNVTSGGGSTEYINNVCIQLPSTGWAYAGGALESGLGFGAPSASGSGWVNFTTGSVAFYNFAIANFSIPVTISTIPTVGTWHVYCYQGPTPSASNPITVTVTTNLQFHSTMTPNYVANGTSYIYTLTVTNDAVSTGIILINITFPAGTWIFNVLVQSTPGTWTVHYDNINTFYLSGPNLYAGQSASITVNMTTPAGAITGEYYWAVKAWNAGAQFLGTYSMKSVVDASRPSVSFVAPVVPYYSVGSGNFVWINASVSDTPSIETYGITVTSNDTRFQPYAVQPRTETSPTLYVYYFTNISAIPDGPLAVQITAVDPAGNVGSSTVTTTIDNTMPQLLWIDIVDQYGYTLHQDTAGTYWMKNDTTAVSVGASFYNLQSVTGNIYFNSTPYSWSGNTTYPSYYYYYYTYYPDRTLGHGYDVTGANLLTVNITLTDGSSPNANRYTNTWTIKRDTILPSATTYGTTKLICGGIIIPNLSATDNVGIDHFAVYFNGSAWWIYPDDLNSSTLDWPGPFALINNITVLELFDFYDAGDMANITIAATDYGGNMGPAVSIFVTVPAGQWYPLEMYPKWNLISLPLLPNSTATSDIFSLLLSKGAAGVNFAYGFDNVGKTWTLNPTTMTDGKGYWVNMKAYDVLIVQGFPVYAPPGSPPPIMQYDLKTGWNLAGFTETDDWYAPDYVASLQSTLVLQSYFIYAYVWSAYDQNWYTVDLTGNNYPYYFYPGQGFYIYMYNDQTLIPPI
jgi:hypothetical protein